MFAQVGNQDHSLMLGVECADNVLFGTKARTPFSPIKRRLFCMDAPLLPAKLFQCVPSILGFV